VTGVDPGPGQGTPRERAGWAGLRRPSGAQWAGGLLVPAATLLLPLAVANPGRLAHPAPWVCAVAALVIYVTQPPLGKGAGPSDPDGRSILGIIVGGLLVSIAPVMDFGFRAELRPPALSGWTLGGTLLVAGGTWLRVWSIAVLGRFFTARVAVQESQPVVDYGPYRHIRHPSYTGALIAAFGAATVCQSMLGAVLTAGVMLPAYLYRIAREEAHLVARLGAPYRSYQARTRRLVPGVL